MPESSDAKLKSQNQAAAAMQAKFMQGLALHQQGKLADAERIYIEILQQQPQHFGALHLAGLIACQAGRPERGANLIAKAISLNANIVTVHNDLGNALLDLNRPQQAVASFDKAIALKPDYAEAYNNRAIALKDLGRGAEALASYDKAIALKPDFAEAHNNRGNMLLGLKRIEDALASFDKAIALQPDFAQARHNRGNVLLDLERAEEALASFDTAIALQPDFAEAYCARGDALLDLERPAEALASYDKALQLRPDLAEAWLGRGNVQFVDRRYDDAEAAFDKAIARKADLEGAWVARGNLCIELKRYNEALAAHDKALALKPDFIGAWLGRGDVLSRLRRHDDAALAYGKAFEIDPNYPCLKGMLLHQKMLSCDWKGIGNLIAEIESDIASGTLSADPFGWQGVAETEYSLQSCAELYNKKFYPTGICISACRAQSIKDKIRIGYLSGEFREQATSFLLIGTLEHHDNSRFEIFAFDNGRNDQSETRKRIEASVPNIIDISRLSDTSAAVAIMENQIDILVNLNGYFGQGRMAVFAQKPSPLQVNYLGFPGTLGANYIDYIIADEKVVPESNKKFYSEKVVYLPNSYQANDRKRLIGSRVFSRIDCKLPESGFVFCCFNSGYKILPEIFDAWMRILKQVESSVLWLLRDDAAAAANLKNEAIARGVNEQRLIFAERMSPPDHLARHRLADLFLDTLPYNAHTTASDALWAGVPVLTYMGETFAGRVAASLLNAVGLPELITTTMSAYEQMAIDLARHPEKLAALKNKLAQNRLAAPLFDTKLFTKHIEAAYSEMHKRHQAGLPPDHIVISN